jgi:formylglycine-generating enzyme required for sulfatase activity
MTGGTHLVSFHLERYQPFELEVAPPSDRRVSAQLKPDFGTLDVRASKPLAVELDGVAQGKAPLQGVELEAGEHVLRVQDPCYKAIKLSFELDAGERLELGLEPEELLKTIEVQPVTPQGEPTRAKVSVDGTELGEVPGAFEVPACARLLTVHSPEHGSFTTTLELLQSGPARIQAALGQNLVGLGGVDFVLVQAGTYKRGSPPQEQGREADEAQHLVTLTRPFLLQATEVTQAQWESLMGNNPSGVACPSCPVSDVSWWDALAYLNALSQQQGLEACYALDGCEGTPGENFQCASAKVSPLRCKGYRLPTEAEWEFAARAGSPEARYGALPEVAWFAENAGGQAHPVSTLQPNAWGLYDMLGNVYEWTYDGFAPYSSATQQDPMGKEGPGSRVIRGGCWQYEAARVRAAFRDSGPPDLKNDRLGFRAALSAY